MNLLNTILLSVPRWLFGLAAIVFIIAMGSSWITGEPFALGGLTFGWSRPHAEQLVASQPRSELEWRQKRYVADLMLRVSEPQFDAYRDEILTCFPNFRTSGYAASGTIISEEESHRIIEGSMGENKKLYDALIAYLNRLEGYSAAYRNGVADPKMFEDSYKGLIKEWYARLHKFMSVAKKKCECTWEPFEKLGEIWWSGERLPEAFGIASVCFTAKK
jgi:hypothetical protein